MKMQTTSFLLAGLLVLTLLASGCGTVQTVSSGEFSPYAGTELDLWIAEHYDGDSFLAMLDTPFSFVFDTVLFPLYIVTLTGADDRY